MKFQPRSLLLSECPNYRRTNFRVELHAIILGQLCAKRVDCYVEGTAVSLKLEKNSERRK